MIPPLLHIDRRAGTVTVRACGVPVLLLTDAPTTTDPDPPELDGPLEQLGERLDQATTTGWPRWLYRHD